ncbi:uracil-DNA glycosylase family protein [Roseibium sp.]|uniref:uracil-DNA glycosylase family protein n=1 Tax=Roseibium sp. TaxID=1936156 RepID=UPI003D0DF256
MSSCNSLSGKGYPEELETLAKHIRACRTCVEKPEKTPLPHAPRPVLQVSGKARLCVCGQAPGTRVHQSGRPFTDPSGDRLRNWMGIGEDIFYDPERLAIVPMGFCFPGLDAKGGDLPPRPECRKAWHDRLFAAMPQIELILVIGQYAQAYHLGKARKQSLTETVAQWRSYFEEARPAGSPVVLPLPHPSWRNNAWIRKNPWFETDLLPVLKREVARLT